MKKLIAVAALVPLLLYALLVAVTYVGQRKLQYHPDRENPAAPAGILDVELVAEDGPRIRAWVTESEGKDAVLILHGNGGNRSNLQSVLFGFRDRGLRAMIVDYRGYGGSEGEPSEEGLYADAEAAWNWLKKNGATRVGIWGFSLGTGVAVELAARHDEAFLILDAPFDSAASIAKLRYPLLPVDWLMVDRYDSIDKIAGIASPLLIFHGTADAVIPIASGRKLFDAAPDPKWFIPVEGADHNSLRSVAKSPYWTAVDRLLSMLRPPLLRPSQ